MTLHIKYDHRCPKCGADYIPYNQVPCPNCGQIEGDRFDYVSLAAESIIFNLQRFGMCQPPMWLVNFLGTKFFRYYSCFLISLT